MAYMLVHTGEDMAYLVKRSCQNCLRTATHELFGNRNASHGNYCAKCGERALKQLQRDEARK